MIRVWNSRPDDVFSFTRLHDDGEGVFVVINFSDEAQTVSFESGSFEGDYAEYFSETPQTVNVDTEIELAPWAYRVYEVE